MIDSLSVEDEIKKFHYDIDRWNFEIKDYHIKKIDEIDFLNWFSKDKIHRFFFNKELSIDICISGTKYFSPDKTILTCFSGAVSGDRAAKPSPILEGFSISSELEIPLISISDPTLSLSNDIKLGWYAGNKYIPDLTIIIATILDKISFYYKKKLILFGGSGGGFASLAIGKLMKSKVRVLSVNPQTNLANHSIDKISRYVYTAYNVDINKYDVDELSRSEIKYLLEEYVPYFDLSRLKFNKDIEILYLQNSSDWHISTHAIPFFKQYMMKKIGKSTFISTNINMGVYIGDWGDGHVVLPKNILCNVINFWNSGDSLINILNYLDDIRSNEISLNLVEGICFNGINVEKLKNVDCNLLEINKPIVFYRNSSEFEGRIIIDLNLVGNKFVTKKELLYTLNYKGTNSIYVNQLISLGFIKSSLEGINFFKYIFTESNKIYQRKIILPFFKGDETIEIEIKSFYPKGKTCILDAQISYDKL